MEITFDQLPRAVSQLYDKLESIERLLQRKGIETAPESDELLTIQDAAKFLRLTVPTIYGLVSKAQLPVSKKGKRLYFSKWELLEWVKGGRKKTNDEIEAEAKNYLKGKAR